MGAAPQVVISAIERMHDRRWQGSVGAFTGRGTAASIKACLVFIFSGRIHAHIFKLRIGIGEMDGELQLLLPYKGDITRTAIISSDWCAYVITCTG